MPSLQWERRFDKRSSPAPIVQVGVTSPITVTVLPISADNFSVSGTVTVYQGPLPILTATLTMDKRSSNSASLLAVTA